MPINASDCLPEYPDITDPIYVIFVPGAQFVGAIASFFLITTFLYRFMGKGYFHRNVKILIFWQLLCYLIMSCIFFGTNFEQLYRYFVSKDIPCSFFKQTNDCILIYHTYALVLGASAMIQVCIGIERLVSCFYNKHYETFDSSLSIAMVSVTLVFSILLQYFVLIIVKPDEFRLGCGGLPLSGGIRTTGLYIMILFCNGFSLLLLVFAYITGHARIGTNEFELNASYQKVEHFRLLKMFSPNVIIQTMIYAFYCATTMMARGMYIQGQRNGVGKTIFMRHNALPYCVTIELILMHVILTKVQNGRMRFKTKISKVVSKDSGEQYFQNLAQQWNKT